MTIKRIIVLVLVLVMIAGMMPMMVFATKEKAISSGTIDRTPVMDEPNHNNGQ